MFWRARFCLAVNYDIIRALYVAVSGLTSLTIPLEGGGASQDRTVTPTQL